MTESSGVAILVVTYDSADEIEACLDAVLAQASDGMDLDVVVVDNASQDGTADVVRRYGDMVRLIQNRDNLGYAEGVNAGFAASRGDWVLLLNPDAVMDEGCLAALVAHLRAKPDAAAAAALLRDPDGGLQRFARREVDLRTVAWTFTELGRRLDSRRGGRALDRRRYEEEWEAGIDTPLAVDCPAAACVLARRELLEPRPLDPELPLFFNDAELWRRLRAGGWTLDVVPGATAVHAYAASVRRVDRARMRAEWVAAVRRYLAPELGPLGRATLYALFLGDAVAAAVLHKLGRGGPETPAEVRGTLGGLGLPGGAQPWLTPVGRRARAAR